MVELKISKYSQPLAVLFAVFKDKYSVTTIDGYSQAVQSGCKTWKLIVAAYIVILLLITLSVALARVLVYIFW